MLFIRKFLFIFTIAICFFQIVYANCPALSEVVYRCSSTEEGKHCAWGAPWYEGFPDDTATSGMKPKHFIRVFWGTKKHQPPPKPGFIGSTICFYQNPVSDHIIELVQNRWGGVLYPEESNWGRGVFDGYPGRECPKSGHVNPSECNFNYP